ncbi:hypothetical protein [Sphingomonas hankookensis]|uniref:hypothetical protein n=1 Tax=Sphingomonas hankookensis TaxID=563996 RepID=UPI00234E8E06|nr:hypothetical protein [Sphingomonas hankookensis]WCP72177.1 hypothetical protein PPZ50_00985 [Sphingomonas hankookensis]
MTTTRNFALAGAALLIVGLFCPIVTVPILGNVNLFNDGTSLTALALLALAVVGGAVALNGRERDTFWPGVAASVLLVYHFAVLQYRLSQMRNSMDQLKDNPFAGIAKAAVGTIQLQWGWLVLAAGAGLLIYAAVQARKEASEPATNAPDSASRTISSVSALLAVAVIGWTLYVDNFKGAGNSAVAGDATSASAETGASDMSGSTASGPSPEEGAYIRDNLRVYDLKAKYYDSILDGRIPGVDFKLKNSGDRTLDRVTVKVVFQDALGKAIAEEEYNPVWVIENSYSSDNNTPLRPNYIWQNEKDKFYSAKSVPSEWATGKVTATITHIEFASK